MLSKGASCLTVGDTSWREEDKYEGANAFLPQLAEPGIMSTTSECQLFLFESLFPIGSIINCTFEGSVCHSSQASTIRPFESIPSMMMYHACIYHVRKTIAGNTLYLPCASTESMRLVCLALNSFCILSFFEGMFLISLRARSAA